METHTNRGISLNNATPATRDVNYLYSVVLANYDSTIQINLKIYHASSPKALDGTCRAET